MVDPITCFGIACNVMQVIAFSHEIYSVVKRINEDGSVDEELRQHADHISESSKGLENYLDRIVHQQLPRNQATLRDVASKCLKTSKKIQTKLDRIDNTRGGSVSRALKLSWMKNALARLEKEMQNYQDAMQSQILVHLCDQNEAANLVQDANFTSLDLVLQNFIMAYSQGQRELKDLILSEAQATQSLVTTQHEGTRAYTKDLELRRELKQKREQLLNSLKDDSMNARKNQIEGADGATFSSVFEANTKTPWQSFTEWLRSDDPLYWISGKAGSGKSTLLNFLFEDGRTKELLNKWRFDCAIYAHFIWSIGTPSQRSIGGLLRSLSYQILTGNEKILDSLLQENPRLLTFTTSNDWSEKDLSMVLFKSLLLHERGVCIFIDGLDEINQKEGPFDLLKLVERISHSPSTKGVKLCVSSRPEPVFIRRLETFPNLKLQDLTRQDMRAYVSSFLQTNPFDFGETDEMQFVDRVVVKAEGVFLWVSLVLKSLQRGMANGDDPKELMHRLETLPSELGNLFEEMLKRIGDDHPLYRKEAALYFNICMDLYDLPITLDPFSDSFKNLFVFAAAVDPNLKNKLLTQRPRPSLENIKENLLAVNRRLISRCAGLLETIIDDEEEEDTEKILSRQKPKPWKNLRVTLIHKSAREFLLDKAGMILDPDETTPTDRIFQITQAFALDDLYPGLHDGEYNNALALLASEDIGLSDEQQSEIFNLTKNIYQRNGWPNIYELAAYNALDYSLEPLRDGTSQSQRAVRNYILLCVYFPPYYLRQRRTVKPLERCFRVVLRLLEIGADLTAIFPSWIQTKRFASIIGFPTPVLARILDSLVIESARFKMAGGIAIVEKILALYLHFGVNVKHKFLHCTGIWELDMLGDSFWPRQRIANVLSDTGDNMVAEFSIASFIHSAIETMIDDPVERLAMKSRLGLDTTKAHSRILLYWRKDTVYAVSDEQSQTLRNIGDPREEYSEEAHEALDNLVKTMKEVDDVHQWLIERGYPIVEESDVEGISKTASLEEMAEIYWRLNEKFGIKAQEKKACLEDV
ncbi:Vegetative incompatibility protein HET-E-1 [Lachnellula hyalina]|uniref:Vegetative incompatibility protein HET-E-1 n=1 Tax=Lachnellula hyalina TaxID=1316788 RepID=A0A8H8R9S6_9HELO|nr:Vegetative incompatibility protein HET-E-1 [Lachnellula hyalina]TVY31187.1 Vegetative incompatibility protein HET-E-1 [Lachnellula hyalina]